MVRARRFLLIVVAIALLGAVGCGGSDDKAVDVGEDSTVATDESTDATDESTDATDGGDAAALFADEDCAFFQEALSSNPLAASGTGTDVDFEEVGNSFQEIADNAPDELSDDFELLADFYVQYGPVVQKMAASGGQPDQETLAELQEIVQGLDQAKFAEALTNISTYFQEECGIGVTATTGG